MEFLMKLYTINHFYYHHLVPLTKRAVSVLLLGVNGNAAKSQRQPCFTIICIMQPKNKDKPTSQLFAIEIIHLIQPSIKFKQE